MKAFLMYPDRDFDTGADLPPHAAALIQDLDLDTVFGAMAAGDSFVFDIARRAIVTGMVEPALIRYRQQILADCLERPDVMRAVYAIAVEAIEGERHIWGGLSAQHPVSLLHRSVDVLQLFTGLLRRLREIADANAAACSSDGLQRLFGMLSTELDERYLLVVADHLKRLRLPGGIVMTAGLGAGNGGTDYVLRKPSGQRRGWREWIGLGDRDGFTFEIADRDQAGAEALQELAGRGVALAAGALAESTDHILDFFRLMRAELGFYVGALNLWDELGRRQAPTCVPEPLAASEHGLSSRGLYDVCLRLRTDDPVVGNDLAADGRALLLITGANRGGKSTLLRSLGLAQLMMQCGLFVAADDFRAATRDAVFTHFKREEDASLRSGKLDEELGRMSAVLDGLTGRSLLLLNESFASTNEREGSEIARQIVRPLLEAGVRIAYVTHLFDLAHGFAVEERTDTLFLRAERLADGERSFRVLEGEPLPTSYGEDVYRRIFGAAARSAATETPPVVGVR